jgi:hypothetical protein
MSKIDKYSLLTESWRDWISGKSGREEEPSASARPSMRDRMGDNYEIDLSTGRATQYGAPLEDEESGIQGEQLQGLIQSAITQAVFDALEEAGASVEITDQALASLNQGGWLIEDEVIRGAEDYKRKLGLTGKPKPPQV